VLLPFIDPAGTLRYRAKKQGITLMSYDETLEMPKKEKIENNIQKLINEAYYESNCSAPILFLISHSVNVLDELTTYHQTFCETRDPIKLNTFSSGKDIAG
jgi:hypothetical protein